MIALKNPTEIEKFVVIHPLFDEPEQKCDPTDLGRIKMSRSVRSCLFVLRGYLMVMGVMLGYHMLDLAGVVGQHVIK
jgi:hypothetical protein